MADLENTIGALTDKLSPLCVSKAGLKDGTDKLVPNESRIVLRLGEINRRLQELNVSLKF